MKLILIIINNWTQIDCLYFSQSLVVPTGHDFLIFSWSDESTPGKESKESYRTLLQEAELQENERTPTKSKAWTPKSRAR